MLYISTKICSLLGNKLHKKLFGTPYDKAQFSAPGRKDEQTIIDYKSQINKSTPLSHLRNRNALRLPKGASEKILGHQYADAIFLFLELKGLIVSSVIFSNDGKIPYARIQEFTGLCERSIRNRITQLKKMGLLAVKKNKSIQLASYSVFRETIRHRCKRTHKLKNNGETKQTVRSLAIFENLARQNYMRKKKIFEREIIQQKTASQSELNYLTSKSIKAQGCGLGKTGKQIQLNLKLSRLAIRKFRKYFEADYDYYVRKYERIYDVQMQQIEFGRPLINPVATLSCSGTARVCGLSGKSSGYMIQAQLKRAGLLQTVGQYITLPDRSAAVYEQNRGLRSDVFGFIYPTKDGNQKKYFRNCANKIFLSLDSVLFKTQDTALINTATNIPAIG